MEKWLAAAGFLALALALLEHWRTRRTQIRLGRMLERAMEEDFTETEFSESLLSALETRMAQYLSASALSARNLREERNKITSLIADVSHQTKTPVANLLLYAQLLLEQDLPEEARGCAEALEHQAERLRFLLESLVKSSRLETGILTLHPQPGPLQPVIDQAAAMAAPRAEAKGVSLIVEPSRAAANRDPKWTEEALFNLLDNAVKYTPPGGSVTVRAESLSLVARIDITDTGPGIPEAEQALIFRRFYRGTAASGEEGAGIGLYLVRQIAAGQGGYVKVFSRRGRGSRFSMYLPRTGGGLEPSS